MHGSFCVTDKWQRDAGALEEGNCAEPQGEKRGDTEKTEGQRKQRQGA